MSATKTITIGIIRETKFPQDSRVTLTPTQCRDIMDTYDNINIVVQRSSFRCYKDFEYENENIDVLDDVSHCSILLGVKEVKIESLISNKVYFFFSHTLKKQPYNRKLLQQILSKNIQLIDYECLTNEKGVRVIAFGRWAGIVGAHNAMYTWGARTGSYQMERMNTFLDFVSVKKLCYSEGIDLGQTRVLLTGDGRVSSGSVEVLEAMGVKRVSPVQFIKKTFEEAVYCQLSASLLYSKSTGFSVDFFHNPAGYKSIIGPYLKHTDVLINGIYWDSRAAPLFTLEEMRMKDFRVRVIADITCDIAPTSSIPSTIRPSTIADPIYGIDILTNKEDIAHTRNCIDMMAVDNLPNELPRDASDDFGNMFIHSVLPQLLCNGPMIQNASITQGGNLREKFQYLQGYVDGVE